MGVSCCCGCCARGRPQSISTSTYVHPLIFHIPPSFVFAQAVDAVLKDAHRAAEQHTVQQQQQQQQDQQQQAQLGPDGQPVPWPINTGGARGECFACFAVCTADFSWHHGQSTHMCPHMQMIQTCMPAHTPHSCGTTDVAAVFTGYVRGPQGGGRFAGLVGTVMDMNTQMRQAGQQQRQQQQQQSNDFLADAMADELRAKLREMAKQVAELQVCFCVFVRASVTWLFKCECLKKEACT